MIILGVFLLLIAKSLGQSKFLCNFDDSDCSSITKNNINGEFGTRESVLVSGYFITDISSIYKSNSNEEKCEIPFKRGSNEYYHCTSDFTCQSREDPTKRIPCMRGKFFTARPNMDGAPFSGELEIKNLKLTPNLRSVLNIYLLMVCEENEISSCLEAGDYIKVTLKSAYGTLVDKEFNYNNIGVHRIWALKAINFVPSSDTVNLNIEIGRKYENANIGYFGIDNIVIIQDDDSDEYSSTLDVTEASSSSEDTEASSTLEDTETSSSSEDTEASSTLEETEASSILDVTEASSSSEETEASSTLKDTEASSTLEETEASSILDVTEASSSSEETEASSTLEDTEASSTLEQVIEERTTKSPDESSTIMGQTTTQAVTQTPDTSNTYSAQASTQTNSRISDTTKSTLEQQTTTLVKEGKGGTDVGLIVGIVVGVTALTGVSIGIGYFIYRKKKALKVSVSDVESKSIKTSTV